MSATLKDGKPTTWTPMLNATLDILHQIEIDVDNDARSEFYQNDEARASYFAKNKYKILCQGFVPATMVCGIMLIIMTLSNKADKSDPNAEDPTKVNIMVSIGTFLVTFGIFSTCAIRGVDRKIDNELLKLSKQFC